jgi:MoxR-like ATPase
VLATLHQAPTERDARLRLEATLREIDAGFAPSDLPAPLGQVRAQLVAAVQS